MLGGEYNWIITSELANQRGPKALFTYVVYTKDIHILVSRCTNSAIGNRLAIGGFAFRKEIFFVRTK